MALDIKQQLRLSQQLVITPQLQQAIKLLQLSRLELQTMIRQELTENPLLEETDPETPTDEEVKVEEEEKSEGEKAEEAREEDRGHEHTVDEVGTKEGELKEPADFDWENYLGTYNTPWPTTQGPPSEELPSYENILTTAESLQEHLLWQLHLVNIPEREIAIGTEIVGNINDDGYFAADCAEIAAKCGEDCALVERVLAQIQTFDPPGAGSRTLEECLVFQAQQLGSDAPLLVRIIREHLRDLERHDFALIARKLKIDINQARTLGHIVQNMEPKPGRPFGADTTQYITPDVFVYKLGEEYVIVLNEDGLPKLQVSNFYRRTLQSSNGVASATKEYIQNKLRSALWFIKSIHQRQQTLYKVTKSIVKFQREFFERGISFLKPMILRDVAEDIGMHESTISRVTTNKYLHSPRGLFELKFFFNSSVQRAEGGDIAAEAVKKRIEVLIHKEDRRHPLSDHTIAQILKKENILIARRTVAKYREAMAIPPSAQRRRME
ncbi:MAG: RNA polymerase factor sigma-54 [Deltaproteobacteria bacterium]|nr:RNA polymerase factor sigma-54 [Deltaproteobacteria bacterium]